MSGDAQPEALGDAQPEQLGSAAGAEALGALAGHDVTITLCPDGPLLLRGPATLLGADGREVPRGRNVVALCRCGGSAIKPLCDGTHKVNGFRSEDG